MGYLGNNALPFDPLRTSGKPLDAQRFNGNGSTTTFTLTHPVTNPTDLEVFVENVQQEPLFAYNATGNQLIFTEAPPSGTNNVYVIYRNIEPGIFASIPDGAVTFNKLANNIRLFTTDNFTGDNTTVAFTLSSAVPDANTLIVAVDGVFQRAPIHYTASGNTITFTSAPPATSNVHVRHLGFRTTQSITALPANTTISQPILQNPTVTGGTLTNTTAIGLTANNTNLFVDNTYIRGNAYYTSSLSFTNGANTTQMGVANTSWFVINSANGPELLNSARYQAIGVAETFDTADSLSNQPSFKFETVSNALGDASIGAYPGLVFGTTNSSDSNAISSHLFYQMRASGVRRPVTPWVIANYSGDRTDGSLYTFPQTTQQIPGILSIQQLNSASVTHIPFYGTGGGGVSFRYTILDPDTGWLVNQNGVSFSFVDQGTAGNTYTVAFTGGGGIVTVQRTSGSQSYRVWLHVQLVANNFSI